MPGWNGSGAFTRLFSWTADAAAGIDILASRMDADTNLITTQGFGNCLTRDGQGAATANLPMNGFKHTNVADAVDPTDYVALGQLQSPGSLPIYATTITATGLISPASGVGIKGSLVALPTGSIGETVEIAAGGSFAEATPTNLMTLDLPSAGIWMMWANATLAPFDVATTMTQGIMCVSNVSANLSGGAGGARVGFAIGAGGVNEMDLATGPFIIITTGVTTVYAAGYVATLTATGGSFSTGLFKAVRIA